MKKKDKFKEFELKANEPTSVAHKIRLMQEKKAAANQIGRKPGRK